MNFFRNNNKKKKKKNNKRAGTIEFKITVNNTALIAGY